MGESKSVFNLGGEHTMDTDAPERFPGMYPVHLQNFDSDAFIAEIVSAVIEISMSDFTEMDLCSTRSLNITSKESVAALQQGISTVFETFLSKFVHEDLAQWETYCREYCLKLPNDFVMPEKYEPSPAGREDEEAKLDADMTSLRRRKLTAEKEAAKLARDIRALEAHLEARGNFIEAFEQLQNLPLVNDLGTAVRELGELRKEADALRAQRLQRLMAASMSNPELGSAGESQGL